MARPLRIEYEGAFYHITARGNEKRDIFREEKDYQKFLQIVKNNLRRFEVKLYSFALMKNHYHLLLETKKANLKNFMHNLNTSYTVYFNRKYERVGHLFQGRYKSIICDKEIYLLELIRYINLNPVRAEIVKEPGEYLYSSYNSLFDDRSSSLIEKDEIQNLFSPDEKKAKELLKGFIQEGIDIKREEVFRDMKVQTVLGDEVFFQKVSDKVRKENIDEEISFGNRYRRRIVPEEIIKIVSKHFGLENVDWSKRRYVREKDKKIAIYLIKKHTDLSLKEIGAIFSLHYSCIFHHYNEVKRDSSFEEDIKEIENELFKNEKFKT